MSSIKRISLRAGPLFAGLCALALVAGCASRPPVQGARFDAPTPLDQYQIHTRDAPDQVGLSVHAEGLSAAQHDALAAFVARWRNADGGGVTLMAPTDAPDPEAARRFVLLAQATLAELGVPYERVQVVGYVQGPAPKALVMASFDTVVADAPDCRGVPWENLTATRDNQAYKRFGCVLAANLAAQVADPRDLRGETALSPADNTRRIQVLKSYRTGKVTASEKDNQANGAISSSVGQQ